MITNESLIAIFPHAEKNIVKNWPLIQAALELEGINSDLCQLAAAATVAVETAHTFAPLVEFGGTAYLNKRYDERTDLGNTPEDDGDGALYCGRGFIQITGKANYERYGREVNADLVKNPKLACDPLVAAHILALYFKEHSIDKFAAAYNWPQVRRRVNGGLNGYDDLMKVVYQLLPKVLANRKAAAAAKS